MDILLKNIENKLSTNKYVETDFLDPVKLQYLNKKLEKYKLHICGGFSENERGILHSKLRDFQQEPVVILKISYNSKYNDISNRDVLGSLMGLQIDRSKIGDIHISKEDGYTLVATKKEMSEFIINNLLKISKATVTIEIAQNCSIKTEKEECSITTTSLRVDAIVSKIFKLSRSLAEDYIKKKKVFINYEVTNKKEKRINENDRITLRGYGRVIIKEVSSKNKKDKYRVYYEK